MLNDVRPQFKIFRKEKNGDTSVTNVLNATGNQLVIKFRSDHDVFENPERISSHKIQSTSNETTTPNNMVNASEERTLLAENFTPSDNDVICSRGKLSQNHPGNLAFQSLINDNITEYATASGKIEKSIIVSDIINIIRRKSGNGGFIKQIDGQWYEIGTNNAREKVSQAFRDRLSGNYKSSASSKRKRKNEMNAKITDDLDAFVASNRFVSKRMRTLSGAIETHGKVWGDLQLELLMNAVNSEILKQLKKETFTSLGGCVA